MKNNARKFQFRRNRRNKILNVQELSAPNQSADVD
jgi:hypothetical protein